MCYQRQTLKIDDLNDTSKRNIDDKISMFFTYHQTSGSIIRDVRFFIWGVLMFFFWFHENENDTHVSHRPQIRFVICRDNICIYQSYPDPPIRIRTTTGDWTDKLLNKDTDWNRSFNFSTKKILILDRVSVHTFNHTF